MRLIEPDGIQAGSMWGTRREHYYLRSTVLGALEELRADWDEADDVPLDSEVSFRDRAYAQGIRYACDELRAHLQPTEEP